MCTAGQRVSLTITGPGPSFNLKRGLYAKFDQIWASSFLNRVLPLKSVWPFYKRNKITAMEVVDTTDGLTL